MRYTVIPTRGRPEQLRTCIKAIGEQCDLVIIVDNNNTKEPLDPEIAASARACIRLWFPEQPPNLSWLWNIGIRYAAGSASHRHEATEWDVAVLNDDAIAPAGWYNAVSGVMRTLNADAAASSQFWGEITKLDRHAAPGVHTRLTGWAFVLRGETGLEADERFQWWCGDDDLSMQAKHGRGLVLIPGYPVENTLANSTTRGELAAQAGRDVAAFVEKWGKRPW